MNRYKLWAYCKFRWKAIGRHGAHSPSLFSFIEYAKANHLLSLEEQLGDFFKTSMLLKTDVLGAYSYLDSAAADSLIIVHSIHDSTLHAKTWETLKSHPRITRSIDFFFVGVVFIKANYKQKEHFIVRI
jgi:hypothetical protein